MEQFLIGGSGAKASTGTGKKKAPPRVLPWIEKYRPKGVNDVCAQEEVVAMLKAVLIEGKELPNMLFYGPPGTGKTSTILAMARDMFGNLMEERVCELNASDERGIKVVREKVKNFAMTTANSQRADGKKCPNFKLIILDEADSMTKSAQEALRRTMEVYSKSTRFCLLCNYVSRIIDPITSRTAKFRFRLLPKEIQYNQIRNIKEAENVQISENAVEELISVAAGDMRRAVNFLQSLHRLHEDEITPDDVRDVAILCPPAKIEEVIREARNKSYDNMLSKVHALLQDGYPAGQFMHQLQDAVIADDAIEDFQKVNIINQIGKADHALTDGADEKVQILAIVSVLQRELSR